MRKALLADDDFLVRSYLKMLSSWEKAGFEITADVRDGEEALEVLKQEPVELVVTDIAMPLMDGIELIKEIKKNYPKVYVIVLSCHDEFDYVKKAMKEGADEYVLKNTLNEESLYTLLETAKEQLEKAEEESGNNQTPEQGVGSTELKGKEKEADANKKFLFFNQILVGTLSQEEREKERISAGIRGKYQNSAVIVIKREEQEASDDPLEEVKLEQDSLEFYQYFREKLKEESDTEKEVIYIGNGTLCCFLDLSGEYKSSVMYRQLTGTASVCYKICKEEAYHYKIGVSNICIGMDALRQAYQQARTMIKNSFYEKDGVAYYEADKTVGKELPGEAKQFLEQAERFRRKNEKEAFITMAEISVKAFKQERTDSMLIRQWFRKLEQELCPDIIGKEHKFYGIIDVEEQLKALSEQAFEYQEHKIPEEISQPVRIAADYVARHYKEAVGLGDAAEAAGVNSTYLSYLFSQEMGIGFAGYLLNLRMEYAKKLLRETTLKMWQVAEQSGFNDYHYFSKVFKKAEGMSPAQYRKRSE